ncbi:discoidin domain-containing protein [Cohaesibacter celericrescens]|uniref:F5/8 type C domain-containing protein n=1 Tax=Cohaesibacter celericrescens TaxID=2067669 RepID=A0A2N5XRW8_9HYPH|nr:discoidin domain-containing protein [Cohaesibacter celericrescens]PLW77266.1 hypothetical protein C0081_10605 [Cohaesibacter celericrescens]
MFGMREFSYQWKNQDTSSKFLIITSLLLVIFAYLPTLQFDYVAQDQWRAFRYSTDAQSSIDRLKQCSSMIRGFYIQTGRPLVWPTECLEHAFVEQISDFRLLRALSLAVIVFTVAYFALILVKFTDNLVSAFVVSAVFVTSPAYSFMYLQGWPALMVLLSIVLSGASYKYLSEIDSWVLGNYKTYIKSAILFLSACMIYPAFAFIVLPLLLINFATNIKLTILKRIIELVFSLFFYALISFIYYGITKIVIFILFLTKGDLPDLGNYKFTAQLSLGSIIDRIEEITLYFYTMSPFNSPSIHGMTLIIVATFILSVIISYFSQNSFKNYFVITIHTATLFITIYLVLLASTSPWLFSKMDHLATRHVISFYLFFSFSIVYLMSKLILLLPIKSSHRVFFLPVLFILFPITLTQNSNSFLEVVTTRSEIEALRLGVNRWIEEKGWSKNRFILVVRPEMHRPIGVASLINNEKFSTENAVLASSHNPVSIPWMLNAVFRETTNIPNFNLVDCGFDTALCVGSALVRPNNVVLAYTDGHETINAPIQPYVMNLSKLTSKPKNPTITIAKTPTISATSTLNNYGPEGLLAQKSPGWHAEKNPKYPQLLSIDLSEVKSFSTISFLPQAPTLTARSAKSIHVKVSKNGKSWIDMGNTDDICLANAPGGWHTLKLPNQVAARFLEIEILSNCGDPEYLTLRGLKIE